jgi:uncharacterized Tic20 family protein
VAALAHGAALLPFWGLIGTIVIWATQKDRSRFVAFQALQALIYQVLPLLGMFVLVACTMCSFGTFFLVIPASAIVAERGGGEALIILASLLTTGLPFLVFGVGLLIWLAYLAYAIYAAVRVFQGRDFRYAVVGRWVERTMREGDGAV